ncbi:vcbs repeat domain protein, partial [Sulfurimonas gotlandica]
MATGKVIGTVQVSVGNVRLVDTEGNLRDATYDGRMYEGEQIYSDDPNALFQIKYSQLPEATAYDGIFRVLADGSVIAGLDGNENMFGDDIDFMETAAGDAGVEGSSAFLEEVATDESSLLGFGRGADEAGLLGGAAGAGEQGLADPFNDQPDVLDVTLGTGEGLIYESHDADGEDGTRDDVSTTLTGTLTAIDSNVDDTHVFNTSDLVVTSTDVDPSAITIDSFVLTNNDHGDDTPNSADFTIVGNFNALGAGETATLTFTYTATDDNPLTNQPNLSDPGTYTIVVTGTNDQPVITDINHNGGEDTISWLIGASTQPQNGEDSGPGEDGGYYDIDGASEEDINALFSIGEGSVVVRDLDPASGEDYNPTDGAALKITMNVEAGETVIFNWTFNDAEGYNMPDDSGFNPGEDDGYRDFGFVVVDGVEIRLLADTFEEGDTNSGVFTHTFADAGEHEITFGAMNDDDSIADSSLEVTYVSGGTITGTENVGHVEALSDVGTVLDIPGEIVSVTNEDDMSQTIVSGNIVQLEGYPGDDNPGDDSGPVESPGEDSSSAGSI